MVKSILYDVLYKKIKNQKYSNIKTLGSIKCK